jgi:hypothetical protein
MAPFLATWLISLTGSSLSPALLFMVSAVVASLTDTTLKETAKMARMSRVPWNFGGGPVIIRLR